MLNHYKTLNQKQEKIFTVDVNEDAQLEVVRNVD